MFVEHLKLITSVNNASHPLQEVRVKITFSKSYSNHSVTESTTGSRFYKQTERLESLSVIWTILYVIVNLWVSGNIL